MGQPSPNDHAGWSPPPGPGPWSGTTPMTCPGRPAGASEHLLHPGLPHHPAGTPPWTSARVGPAARRRRSRRPAKRRPWARVDPRVSQHGQRRTIPCRPARCRQATTPPADHGGTSTHCAQPEGGPPHRATPGPARRGQRGGSAADTEGLSVRTPGCTGRLYTGRVDAGRPLDRLDGRPHGGTRRGGQGNVRPGRRPDILETGDHPLGGPTSPGHGAWGARPPRTTLR